MNIGISIEGDVLYLVARDEKSEKPSYYKFEVNLDKSDNDLSSGYIWDRVADEEIKDKFLEAEKIALVIPAGICYTKKIFYEPELAKNRKDYPAWVAGNQLPGDISKYIYGFIPLAGNEAVQETEVLFYAALSERFWPYFYAVIKDESYDRTCLLPEYTALDFLLRKSINTDGDVQAGMINVGTEGAAAIFIKNGIIFSNRYFPLGTGNIEVLKTDLETYFLSLIDPAMETEIFIAGKGKLPSLQLDVETRIKYNSMSAGFISALGSVEYITAGGKCELPAEN